MRRTALRISGEGERVLAYRDRVFLFTDANDEEDQKVAAEAAAFLGLTDKLDDPDDPDVITLMEAVGEHRPEVLTGYIDGETLRQTGSDYRHGRGSRLLRSLLRQLGLRDTTSENTDSEEAEHIPSREVTGRLPDSLLHGTTSEHMSSIFRKGLTADEAKSNYAEGRLPENVIRHPDTVFLAESPVKAAYHAENAVHQEGVRRSPGRDPYSTRRAEAGFPVIVEFTIPDKAKFVPDYDVDTWSVAGEGSYEQTERSRQRKREGDPRTEDDPFKLSRKFGTFGYRGRIPASFIKSIMIRTSEESEGGFSPQNWASVTREQLERAIEFGDPAAWEWEDTCPECGEVEGDCECEEESVTAGASRYWRVTALTP